MQIITKFYRKWPNFASNTCKPEVLTQTCHSYWFYQYIQIFYPLNLAKYWFSPLKFGKIQIFSGMWKGFLYIFFSHTDFSPKIQIFLVLYTDFVLDQSGRSANILVNLRRLSLLERFFSFFIMHCIYIGRDCTERPAADLIGRMTLRWLKVCLKFLFFSFQEVL